MTEYMQPDTSHLSTVFLFVSLLHWPPILFRCFQLLPQNSFLKTVAIVTLWKCGSILAFLVKKLPWTSHLRVNAKSHMISKVCTQPSLLLPIWLSSYPLLCSHSVSALGYLLLCSQSFTSLLSVTTVRRFFSSKLSRTCSLNFIRSLCKCDFSGSFLLQIRYIYSLPHLPQEVCTFFPLLFHVWPLPCKLLMEYYTDYACFKDM